MSDSVEDLDWSNGEDKLLDPEEEFFSTFLSKDHIFALKNEYFLPFVTILIENLQTKNITTGDNKIEFVFEQNLLSSDDGLLDFQANIYVKYNKFRTQQIFKIPVLFFNDFYESDHEYHITIPIRKFWTKFKSIEEQIISQKKGYVVFTFGTTPSKYYQISEDNYSFFSFFKFSKSNLCSPYFQWDVENENCQCMSTYKFNYLNISYLQHLKVIKQYSDRIFKNYYDYLNNIFFSNLGYVIPFNVISHILDYIPCVYAFYYWYDQSFVKISKIEKEIKKLQKQQNLLNDYFTTAKEPTQKRKPKKQIVKKTQRKRQKR